MSLCLPCMTSPYKGWEDARWGSWRESSGQFILAPSERGKWLFLVPESSRHRRCVRGWRRLFGTVGYSCSFKSVMAAAGSSYSPSGDAGGGGTSAAGWEPAMQLWAREAIQDHPGWRPASALRLARARRKHWLAWVTAAHYPVMNPGGQAG